MRVFRGLFSVYAILVFVAAMFFFLPFVLLGMLFGRITGGNLLYRLFTAWSYLCLALWGMPLRVNRTHELPQESSAIFIFNHISYIDIPFLLVCCRGRHIRILGKAAIAKIPVFGLMYKYAVILVDRTSAEARAKSVDTLKKMLGLHISVCIAPEGTFNETHAPLQEFYNGAFKISYQTNVPVQPIIFLNAYDRLHYSSVLSFNPGTSYASFLPPSFPGAFKDFESMKLSVYKQMETYLVKNSAAWIKPSA